MIARNPASPPPSGRTAEAVGAFGGLARLLGIAGTDEETLGIMLARYLAGDGVAILRTAQAALDEANFHREADHVREMAAMLARVKAGGPP